MPPSAFVGHFCVQNGVSARRGCQCVWYQTYLIADSHDLPDAIAYAFGGSVHAGSKADALSVRIVANKREEGVDVEHSENESFKDNDERDSKLSDFMLETGSLSEHESKQRMRRYTLLRWKAVGFS